MRILIKNGTIVTADATISADVLVDDHKIVALYESRGDDDGFGDRMMHTVTQFGADKVIDAAGKYVIPGAIDVHSELGRGTTFRALFPCAEGVHEKPPRPAPPPEVARGSGTVLIIDDEPIVRVVAEQTLAAGGYRVLTAADGQEGLRKFTDHEDEVSLILLDMTMPGMGGEEVFGLLKSVRGDVRVLLSSGYDEQDVTRRFEGTGPAGFIQKPYRPAELLAKVRDVLGAPDLE